MIGFVAEIGYFAWVLFKHTWPVFAIAIIGGAIYGHN